MPKESGERILGKDPKQVKAGLCSFRKFGPMAQIERMKKKF
jgi:hypothetical protein